MIIFSHTNHYDGLSDDSAVRLVLSQTVEPQKDGPIYRMFQRMGLDFDLPATLRMHPSFAYSMGTEEELGRHPAMVLPYQDGRGVFVGVELCFLSPDGRFAPVVEPRMQYWLNEAVPGAFHAIDPPQGEYGVAVGYANALAAHHFTGAPMCAVDSANDLAALDVPAVVHSLTIFGDDTCTEASRQLKARCEARGIRVQIMEPPTPHSTWLIEFTFRGAIPVDDVAADLSAQQPPNDATDGGKHE